jgi:hypothetical protein
MGGNSKEITIKHKGKSGACPVKEFDLGQMVKHPAIVMIAKRGSGKSWVVRAVLSYYAKIIPSGIIIAPTDKMSGFYKEFVPDTYIYYEFKSETIKRLLDRQTDLIDKAKEKKKNENKDINTKAFIVMDDCLASKGEWAKDQTVAELLMNGRHYHITYILTMQFPLGIKPELRCNFDYVFLLANDNISDQKRLYEHYAGIFPNFEAFKQVFAQLTADYGCMVLVNRDANADFFDKVYYYKAPDLSNSGIIVGGSQYKKFHELNYREDWNKKDKQFDVNDAFSKQKLKNSKVKVNKIENVKKGSKR